MSEIDKFSAQNLSQLAQDKTYYLSDQGEIKAAGPLTKLKLYFGLGHSRQRVNNLINAFQTSLLDQVGKSHAYNLYTALKTLDDAHAITGADMSQIARNFRQANQHNIEIANAKNQIHAQIDKSLRYLQNNFLKGTQNTKALKNVLDKAFKPLLQNLPLKEENGEKTLNKEKFDALLLAIKNKVENLIIHAVSTTKVEITEEYANYMTQLGFCDFYDPDAQADPDAVVVTDGTGAENLKGKDEAFAQLIISQANAGREQIDKNTVDAMIKKIEDYGNSGPIGKKNAPFLRKAIEYNALPLLKNAQSQSRPVEKVLAKLDTIIANLNQMAALVHEPTLYDLAMDTVVSLGDAVKPEMLKGIYELASKQDLSAIKDLSATSSLAKINQAFDMLATESENIITKANSESKLALGAEPLEALRAFTQEVFYSRLTSVQVKNLHEAFSSLNGQLLYQSYDQLQSDRNVDFAGKSQVFCKQAASLLNGRKHRFDQMLNHLNEFLKLPPMGDYQRHMHIGNPLTPEIKNIVNTSLLNRTEEFFDNFISQNVEAMFSGFEQNNALQKIKQQITTTMIETINKSKGPVRSFNHYFNELLSEQIKHSYNSAILKGLQEIRSVGTPGKTLEHTQFAKDLMRNFECNLVVKDEKGEPKMIRLDKDPKKACDQIAQYVTGKPEAQYATLAPAEKKSAELMISLLSQAYLTKLGSQITNVFTPAVQEQGIYFTMGNGQPPKQSLSIEKNENGDLVLKAHFSQNLNMLQAPDLENQQAQDVMLDPQKSTETIDVVYTLPKQEIEKIANMDVTDLTLAERDNLQILKDKHLDINGRPNVSYSINVAAK
ncbi:MAG: hypothetical protein K6F05_06515 [Succinivibrio sp.]|nr:hypothetical protein [Succinivibrio sp.]